MMKMNSREKALYDVQATGFAVYDANLFLNTHPDDCEALAAMEEYQNKYAEARAHYEENYGPLTAPASCTDEYWAWVKGPWPWQMED